MKKLGCGVALMIFGILFVMASQSSGYITVSIFLVVIGGLMVYIDSMETRVNNRVHEVTNAGNYIAGIPSIDVPLRNIKLTIEGDRAVFYQVVPGTWSKPEPLSSLIGSLDLNAIIDIGAFDRSFIQQKYAGAVGVRIGFAFLATPVQSRSIHELCYVVIAWRDGRFDREIILEFIGPGSHTRASTLQNQLINSANLLSSNNT